MYVLSHTDLEKVGREVTGHEEATYQEKRKKIKTNKKKKRIASGPHPL